MPILEDTTGRTLEELVRGDTSTPRDASEDSHPQRPTPDPRIPEAAYKYPKYGIDSRLPHV